MMFWEDLEAFSMTSPKFLNTPVDLKYVSMETPDVYILRRPYDIEDDFFELAIGSFRGFNFVILMLQNHML